MLLLFLLLNCFNVPVFASLLQNVAILKGEQLTLQCTIEFPSKFLGWHFVQVGTNSEKPITTSPNDLTHDYQGRAGVFEIMNSSNSSQLTIRSVQLSDAGVFGCKSLINSSIIQQRAHVVVLDGNVRLLRQNSSHISCEIVYNGNWTPELRLSATDSAKGGAMLNASEIRFINQSNGNRTVIVVMETSSFSFNQTIYSCQLKFTNRSLAFEASHVASNIPSYRDNASCKADIIHDTCYMEDLSESTTTNSRDSPPHSFNSVLVISVGVGSFFVIVFVFLFLLLDTRRKSRILIQSKHGSTAIPNIDILNGSEEGSNGFSRSLPEIPLEVNTSRECLNENSASDLIYSNSDVQGNRYVAADGTEYLIMNAVPQKERSSFRVHPVQPTSAFQSMTYVSIDHLQTQLPPEH